MHRRFAHQAHFVLVYIAEAHAFDEWPVGDHLLLGRRILQPRHLEERLALAGDFQRSYGLEALEMLVEDPSLDAGAGFDATYAAWPTRFYVLQQGQIVWIACPDEKHEYDTALDELELLARQAFA